jgi:hypothetical protein
MLQATVRWGKEPGVVLKPHRFRNGKFKASEFKGGRSEWAASEEDLKGLLRKGWSIRMSNPDSDYHRAPSLIIPAFVRGW